MSELEFDISQKKRTLQANRFDNNLKRTVNILNQVPRLVRVIRMREKERVGLSAVEGHCDLTRWIFTCAAYIEKGERVLRR